MTVQLLAIIGLLIAGGVLLLWVCWKMWRELQEAATHDQAEAQAELELAIAIEHGKGPSPEEMGLKRKTFGAALMQILIADVTMSLDNVLAVAGAAHDHPWIMVFGLVLSIGLMGVAATYIAKLLSKYRWIGYVGLVIVLYVALHMIWDGYRSTVVRAACGGAAQRLGPGLPRHHRRGSHESLPRRDRRQADGLPGPDSSRQTVGHRIKSADFKVRALDAAQALASPAEALAPLGDLRRPRSS